MGMRDTQYDQVHDLPEGYVNETLTYTGVVSFIDVGRLAIYLLCFAGFFMMLRHLIRLI